MSNNIQALVGVTFNTSRDLSVDIDDMVWEARRRNPETTDQLVPKGTELTGLRVEKGRLVCMWAGMGEVKLHFNHTPASSYGQPKGETSVALQAWKGEQGPRIAALVANDPELQALAAKVATKKKEQERNKLREAERERLQAELAALGE